MFARLIYRARGHYVSHLCSQVTRLCDLSVDGDSVTSVCWNERVSHEFFNLFSMPVICKLITRNDRMVIEWSWKGTLTA